MSSTINVRCTDEEHAQITVRAKSYGISFSEYVRLVCLNAKIEIKVRKANK